MVRQITDRIGCVIRGQVDGLLVVSTPDVWNKQPLFSPATSGAKQLNWHQRIDSTLRRHGHTFSTTLRTRGRWVRRRRKVGARIKSRRLAPHASLVSAVSRGASRNHRMRAAATGRRAGLVQARTRCRRPQGGTHRISFTNGRPDSEPIESAARRPTRRRASYLILSASSGLAKLHRSNRHGPECTETYVRLVKIVLS